MRIQIGPSDIFVTIDGVKTRVWNGITEDGAQCFVFASCVAIRSEDVKNFPIPLMERPAPAWFMEKMRNAI